MTTADCSLPTATGSHAPGDCDGFERASTLHRRTFLQGMAATATGAVATSMFGDAMMQATFGAATGGNVLVVVSMRGGVDGLGMVVPHGDPGYYSARPKLAVPRESLVAQDSFFGLHPKMKPLVPYFDAGEFAAVHAVGMAVPNRSHFLAMEEIEDADPGSSERCGWVNRMIGLDGGSLATEAVHVTSSMTPTMLTGPTPVLATNRLDKLSLRGADNGHATKRYGQLGTMWSQSPGALGDAARSAVQVSKQFAATLGTPYRPSNGAVYPLDYPANDLSKALMDTAHLIRADVGTQVVSIDFGSWDMHSEYGAADYGDMQSKVDGFARALAAFLKDLGELRQRVTVVTISEFGRRVQENGNRGLDHGWGNMMLVLGGGVKGGRYYGSWPGLSAGKLIDGDLQVTTDYRQVLGEVITRRFPDRSIASVFPGLSFSPLGLMT